MNISRYKKIISFVVIFLFLVLGFLFLPKGISNIIFPKTPIVIGGNFDLNYKKVPVSVDFIDFTFSETLDRKSISNENIKISPKIEGDFVLINSNTIRFSHDSDLEVGKIYDFTFENKIKSSRGKNIEEVSFELEIVSNAKVVKITPEGNLDNLNQNFAVFFSVPMVALTDLDSRDELPCPIVFKPEVKGKCNWTTTSVLEFIPDKSLFGATKYEIIISNKDGLLYPLVDKKSVTIQTTRLDFYFPTTFNVIEGINFSTNFDVSLDEIEKKILLSGNHDKLETVVTKNKNTFNIKLKNNSFTYNTNYYLENINIDKNINVEEYKKLEKNINGIDSVNGNIPYERGFNKTIKSLGFLNNINVFKNIYSNTGALINTKRFYIDNNYERNKYIPIKNVFFNLTFEKEVSLNKENFSFKDIDNKNIKFELNYLEDKKYNSETDKYEKFINKNKIKLSIKEDLINDTTYELIVSKNINKYLKENIVKKYFSSKKLLVKDFTFVNYSKSCLYLSSEIDNVWKVGDELFESIPSSRKVSISSYEYIPNEVNKNANKYLKTGNNYNKQSYSGESMILETNKTYSEYLLEEGYCRRANKGEYLYVLNTRLNPNSDYKLQINNKFGDKYGNKLSGVSIIDKTTGNILDKDKYLYSSISKDVNIIPDNLPIVINLETVNLEKVELEICEMDELGYMDYDNNNWKKGFSPKCLNQKKEFVEVKNNNWNITFNKFDLEKDILKDTFKSNFILVKATAAKNKNNDDNTFENIYIRSNIAVAYEAGVNKQLFFITDLKGNLESNLKLDFYKHNYKSNTIAKVASNTELSKKTNVFENIGKKIDFSYLVIKDKNNNQSIGFLDLNNDSLSNYGFKYISGETTSEKQYLYLYTERPIYKPGDTVYFKGLLREFKATGYTSTDIKNANLELVGPSGKTIDSKKVIIDNNSNFIGEFNIPKEVDLGKFRFRFNTSNGKNNYTVRNNAYFHIEEYRKPTFKVNVKSDKNDFIVGDTSDFIVNPEYYFGGKMINTVGDYSVLTQNYFFDAKDYSDYQFGEGYRYFDCIYWGYCNYSDSLNKSGNFTINNNGEYKYSYDFSGEEIEGEKLYNFSFDVTDPDTKRTVSKTISKVLHNTDGYVGIKSKYYNSKKEGINLDGIILDFEAKPLNQKNVKIELIKKEWKSVKKKGVDGIFYNDYSLDEKLESTYKSISNNKGEFEKNIKPKYTGEYEIKVVYTGSNKKEFISSKTVYVAGNEYMVWHNDNNDITEFVAEKVQVKIGDKAEYMLKTPINNGKALIVIEKDNDILDYFIHDIKSYSDKINIDVIDTYYPNYYLKAFLIGEEAGNPLPIYKRALVVTKVNTDYKKLDIEIISDKEDYLPGEQVKLNIKIKDYLGNLVRNADLSLSLVDESLLALKGNPKKNPYAFFYDLKRYLGISTYTSLKNLIEKLEIKDTSNGEKGGAGEQVKGGDSKKKRGEFKDTAFWQGSGMTDENGVLEITTSKLPDNLTTWVIEVLANTKNDTKIGVNYETIITSKKLLINDNLPRFFGSNDTIILSPVVFNKTGTSKKFNIELNIDNAEIIGNKKHTVTIANSASKTINFEIKINDIGISENKNIFTSKINFKATSDDGKQVDEIEKFVMIKEVSTPEYVSTFGKTEKASFEEKINIGEIKNSAGNLTINYSSTLLNGVLDGVHYLNNYPYGCSEQKTSAIMPNIFIKQLYSSVGKDFDLKSKMVEYWAGEYLGYEKKSLDEVIKEYLVNIRKYQKNDGGFVYFYDISYGYNYSDFALSSYILESGANIKKVGFNLDEKTYFNTVQYLKNRFYKNSIEGCKITQYNNCKYSEVDRLKAISAILEFDDTDYEAYKMYKLLNFKNNYNSLNLEKVKVIAKLYNLKSISSKEKNLLQKESKKIIDKIISEELIFNPKGSYLGKSSYYSRFRNTLSLLEAVSISGLENFSDIEVILDNMNRWIIGQKKEGSFGSTSDNIALVKTMTKYLESSGELKDIKNFTKLKLNNKIIEERKFNNDNKLEIFSKIIKLDDIKNENSFVIDKSGNGTIYYDLNLSYYKEASEIKARDEGFFVETKYYKYNDYKKIESDKKNEWKEYSDKIISYEDLKYSKNIFEYLTEVKGGKIGDLLVVKNKIITTETRDKIAFEGFIPSGAELVNPNLDTSSKKTVKENNFYFDKLEYRTDRIFGYKSVMYPGIFEFTYLMRLTHSGNYSIKPTRISEFYNVEVFGRNKGKVFRIEK